MTHNLYIRMIKLPQAHQIRVYCGMFVHPLLKYAIYLFNIQIIERTFDVL